MDQFPAALALLLSVEGGVSTARTDSAASVVAPGRPHTNLGISLKQVQQFDADGHLPAWLRTKLDTNADGILNDEDVVLWSKETAEDFYRFFYWIPAKCDLIPWPLSNLVFDLAVNAGKPQAIKTLQRALGVSVDGIFGKDTLDAVGRLKDQKPVLLEFTAQKLNFYRQIPTADANFLGWSRRSVERLASSLEATE